MSDETPVRKPLYTRSSWKNVLEVYTCGVCGLSITASEDDMKLHVVDHFPESQREDILSKLIALSEGA